MSKIKEIIEAHEWLCDKGHPADETGRHIALLKALDVLADELARIADALAYSRKVEAHPQTEYAERVKSDY